MSIAALLLTLASTAAVGPPAEGADAPAVVTDDPVLAEVRILARAGAQDLALAVLERNTPSFAIDPVRWRRWDAERLYLLRSRERWDAILEVTAISPDGLDANARAARQVQRSAAAIALGMSQQAIAEIRHALWTDPELDPAARRALRRALIDAYRAAGDLDAARTAMQRHRQDYRDGAEELRIPQARVYLLGGEPAAAIGLLASGDDDETVALRTLAQLRTGTAAPATLLPTLVARASRQDRAADARRRDWLLAATAAASLGNGSAEVSAEERALALLRSGALPDAVFEQDGDDLWDTYLRVGLALGNRANLIQGDDLAWMEAAQGSLASDPIGARSLLAFLALRGYDPAMRAEAAAALGEQLWAEAWGPDTAFQLFLRSAAWPDPSALPGALRYRLVDLVLARGDVDLASQLMRDLTAPPTDADPVEWILRRSRIMILGGRPQLALDGLGLLVSHPDSVDISRLLQPLFDLQAAELHREALPLLGGLLSWQMEPQQRRELLYWIADSEIALGEAEEAARLYLASATLLDPFAMDPWAQTARFQAADALADAGRVADARALYLGLLSATQDPGRQALLRQKLQSLLLRDDGTVEP